MSDFRCADIIMGQQARQDLVGDRLHFLIYRSVSDEDRPGCNSLPLYDALVKILTATLRFKQRRLGTRIFTTSWSCKKRLLRILGSKVDFRRTAVRCPAIQQSAT